MTAPSNVEYFFLHYLPNPISDNSVSIAAVLLDSNDLDNGICAMCFAADWQRRVRLVDPNSDLKMLEAMLEEIRDRLRSPEQRADMIEQMEGSFSNVIQVSERRKCSLEASLANIEDYANTLLQKGSKMYPGLSEMQARRLPVTF